MLGSIIGGTKGDTRSLDFAHMAMHVCLCIPLLHIFSAERGSLYVCPIPTCRLFHASFRCKGGLFRNRSGKAC